MATSDQVEAKIAALARQLAEEFGEIDEEETSQPRVPTKRPLEK